MNKNDIRTPADALAYYTDCTLATVCDMAMTKSRKVGEYKRQTGIAQGMCDFIRDFKIEPGHNRCNDVKDKFGGSVEAWAKDVEIRFNTNKDKVSK